MAKTKIIEIDSLSKYIRHINKLDNVSYYRGEGFKTVQIGFVVKFKSYTVVCHGDERGNWFVCDECTLLK